MKDNITTIIAATLLVGVMAFLLLSGLMFQWVEFLWCGGATFLNLFGITYC